MKRGFTLIEMLVVIGIIAVLMAALIGGYAGVTKAAEKKKCQELVSNVATALTALFQTDGAWPKALLSNGKTDGELDEKAAYPLAKGGYLSLTVADGNKLGGFDRFGVVSPWAAAHIKRAGNAAQLGDKIGSYTLRDHILHYALDLDGDGIIDGASVGGENVRIRATAAVWCCGKDGKMEKYSDGIHKDDVYSWTYGQTQNVQ